MTQNKRLFIKVISLILAGCFCLQELSFSAVTADALNSVPKITLSQNPTRFETPLDFSSLQEIHKGDKDTFIIHIQDAHSNLSGQRNLSETLDAILSKYGISLVLIEGSSQEATLDPIKKLAPSKEVLKRVAKSFLIQGNLAGEEYLNLTSDHPMRIMGIEDEDLYLESVKNYALLADQREKVLSYLGRIQQSVEKIKAKVYPQEILSYEKLSHGRSDALESNLKDLLALAKKHGITLDDLPNLQTLSILQEKEKSIDFNSVNLEQVALIEEMSSRGDDEDLKSQLKAVGQAKNQRVSQFSFLQKILDKAQEKNIALSGYAQLVQYGEYLKIFSDLDLDSVLEESTKAENRVYEKLLQSRDSRLIRSIDRYMKLLDTAFHIRMTTGEFKLFQANERDFLTIPCLAFMNERLASFEYFEDLIPHEDTLEEAKSTLSDFYDSVDKRDMSFIQNAQRIMKEQHQNTAVLISGGYHTEHLKKLFREQGYSYAVVTPIVTSETNQKHYEDLLLSSVRKEVKKVEVVQGEKKSQIKALSAFEREIAQIQKTDGVKAPALATSPARLAKFVDALGIQGSRLSAVMRQLQERQGSGEKEGARVEGRGLTAKPSVRARMGESQKGLLARFDYGQTLRKLFDIFLGRKGRLNHGNIALKNGNITLKNGNIALKNGNIALKNGNIALKNGNIALKNGNIAPENSDITGQIPNSGQNNSHGFFEAVQSWWNSRYLFLKLPLPFADASEFMAYLFQKGGELSLAGKLGSLRWLGIRHDGNLSNGTIRVNQIFGAIFGARMAGEVPPNDAVVKEGIFLEERLKKVPRDQLRLVEIQPVEGKRPQYVWIPKTLYHGTPKTHIDAGDLKPGEDGVIWLGTTRDNLSVLSHAIDGQVLEFDLPIEKVFVGSFEGVSLENTQGMRRKYGYDAFYDPEKGNVAYIPEILTLEERVDRLKQLIKKGELFEAFSFMLDQFGSRFPLPKGLAESFETASWKWLGRYLKDFEKNPLDSKQLTLLNRIAQDIDTFYLLYDRFTGDALLSSDESNILVIRQMARIDESYMEDIVAGMGEVKAVQHMIRLADEATNSKENRLERLKAIRVIGQYLDSGERVREFVKTAALAGNGIYSQEEINGNPSLSNLIRESFGEIPGAIGISVFFDGVHLILDNESYESVMRGDDQGFGVTLADSGGFCLDGEISFPYSGVSITVERVEELSEKALNQDDLAYRHEHFHALMKMRASMNGLKIFLPLTRLFQEEFIARLLDGRAFEWIKNKNIPHEDTSIQYWVQFYIRYYLEIDKWTDLTSVDMPKEFKDIGWNNANNLKDGLNNSWTLILGILANRAELVRITQPKLSEKEIGRAASGYVAALLLRVPFTDQKSLETILKEDTAELEKLKTSLSQNKLNQALEKEKKQTPFRRMIVRMLTTGLVFSIVLLVAHLIMEIAPQTNVRFGSYKGQPTIMRAEGGIQEHWSLNPLRYLRGEGYLGSDIAPLRLEIPPMQIMEMRMISPSTEKNSPDGARMAAFPKDFSPKPAKSIGGHFNFGGIQFRGERNPGGYFLNEEAMFDLHITGFGLGRLYFKITPLKKMNQELVALEGNQIATPDYVLEVFIPESDDPNEENGQWLTLDDVDLEPSTFSNGDVAVGVKRASIPPGLELLSGDGVTKKEQYTSTSKTPFYGEGHTFIDAEGGELNEGDHRIFVTFLRDGLYPTSVILPERATTSEVSRARHTDLDPDIARGLGERGIPRGLVIRKTYDGDIQGKGLSETVRYNDHDYLVYHGDYNHDYAFSVKNLGNGHFVLQNHAANNPVVLYPLLDSYGNPKDQFAFGGKQEVRDPVSGDTVFLDGVEFTEMGGLDPNREAIVRREQSREFVFEEDRPFLVIVKSAGVIHSSTAFKVFRDQLYRRGMEGEWRLESNGTYAGDPIPIAGQRRVAEEHRSEIAAYSLKYLSGTEGRVKITNIMADEIVVKIDSSSQISQTRLVTAPPPEVMPAVTIKPAGISSEYSFSLGGFLRFIATVAATLKFLQVVLPYGRNPGEVFAIAVLTTPVFFIAIYQILNQLRVFGWLYRRFFARAELEKADRANLKGGRKDDTSGARMAERDAVRDPMERVPAEREIEFLVKDTFDQALFSFCQKFELAPYDATSLEVQEYLSEFERSGLSLFLDSVDKDEYALKLHHLAFQLYKAYSRIKGNSELGQALDALSAQIETCKVLSPWMMAMPNIYHWLALVTGYFADDGVYQSRTGIFLGYIGVGMSADSKYAQEALLTRWAYFGPHFRFHLDTSSDRYDYFATYEFAKLINQMLEKNTSQIEMENFLTMLSNRFIYFPPSYFKKKEEFSVIDYKESLNFSYLSKILGMDFSSAIAERIPDFMQFYFHSVSAGNYLAVVAYNRENMSKSISVLDVAAGTEASQPFFESVRHSLDQYKLVDQQRSPFSKLVARYASEQPRHKELRKGQEGEILGEILKAFYESVPKPDFGGGARLVATEESAENFSLTSGARLSDQLVQLKDIPVLEANRWFKEALAKVYKAREVKPAETYPFWVRETSINSLVQFAPDPRTGNLYAVIYGRLEQDNPREGFEEIGRIDLTEAVKSQDAVLKEGEFAHTVFSAEISPVTDALAVFMRDFRLAMRELPKMASTQGNQNTPIQLTRPVMIIKTFSEAEWTALPPSYKEVMKILAQKVQSRFGEGQVLYQIEVIDQEGNSVRNNDIFNVIDKKDIPEGTKVMYQGHLPDRLLQELGTQNEGRDFKAQVGALITESRIGSGSTATVNMMPELSLDVLAIALASPENFDPDSVATYAGRHTGSSGLTANSMALWGSVREDATFEMYQKKGLVIRALTALPLNQFIQAARLALQAITSSA